MNPVLLWQWALGREWRKDQHIRNMIQWAPKPWVVHWIPDCWVIFALLLPRRANCELKLHSDNLKWIHLQSCCTSSMSWRSTVYHWHCLHIGITITAGVSCRYTAFNNNDHSVSLLSFKSLLEKTSCVLIFVRIWMWHFRWAAWHVFSNSCLNNQLY